MNLHTVTILSFYSNYPFFSPQYTCALGHRQSFPDMLDLPDLFACFFFGEAYGLSGILLLFHIFVNQGYMLMQAET